MKHGLTLVEIMIVIAIIGILAAMAIPNIARSQNREAKENITTYQHNGHTFIHDPNCGCRKYGKL